MGSSPHTRGLHDEIRKAYRGGWIIPAHAGFTFGGAPSSGWARDHPRMRGVYGARASTASWNAGSSPHARGLRHQDRLRQGRQGIIPACAGFTTHPGREVETWRDHPRMRGVYPGDMPAVTEEGRIIPACAGFTEGAARLSYLGTDHPRMRGVYQHGRRSRATRRGSSSHARGLRHPHHQALPDRGIIPACAGFTSKSAAVSP